MPTWLSGFFASARVAEDAAGLTITSGPARYVAWVLAFVVLLPLSWHCRRKRIGGYLAHGVFFASFTIPLIIVPGIALESVRITPASLRIRTGLWFDATVHEVSWNGVESVTERVRVRKQRLATRRDLDWLVRFRDGTKHAVALPDLLDGNRSVAAEYLRRHGIPYVVE